MRRTNVVRKVMELEVKRGRGRTRKKWMDRFRNGLGEKVLSGQEV